MNVNADPRKLCDCSSGASKQMKDIPNKIMSTNCDGLPRKSPSSSCRQCRTRKYMLKMKSMENRPKNRNGLKSLHIWPSNMSCVL